MIISASRRTDIPSFFSDWIINRFRERYACVRNPMNFHQVSRICLSPDVVDCIVFWSKNPAPMLDRLDALKDYMFYFQFTLNAYGRDLETALPAPAVRIRTFRALSERIGRNRVLWRYDPIIINDRYTIDWHIRTFRFLAGQLCPYTEKVTVSFLDLYPTIARSQKGAGLRELSFSQKTALAESLAQIARSCGLKIAACAEDIDLTSCGVAPASCIDGSLISKLLHCSIDAGKDKNQRRECGCIQSIDLGLYNTCQNGCAYCYANHNDAVRRQNFAAYDPRSPLLCSRITEADRITERKAASCRDMQLRLFEG